MGDLKPWQIVVIIAAVIAVGFTGWRLLTRSGPKLPNSVMLVDVKTGALFELDISGRRAGYYPAPHPDTKEYTLMPVFQAEDGSWRISGHSLPALQDVRGETPAVTDPSTGRVTVQNGRPRRLRL